LNSQNDRTVAGEVEDRLKDLFGENEESPAIAGKNDSPEEDSPIRNLKSTILSIDWEISDDLLDKLIKEIGGLENTYKDDKNLLVFFQLLGSVGKYVKSTKANAHPGAIRLLNSVYNSLEIVILSEGITTAEKRKILHVQVEQFKKLKEQIALRKAEMAKKKEVIPSEIKPAIEEKEEDVVVQVEPAVITEELPPDISRMTPQETVAYVLTEVKQLIRAEFKALREELKL
jgi:hypothetical protein